MSTLPTASITVSCGACGASLDHDGDVLVCWDCGLDYSAEDPEGHAATYRDEGDKPCGKPHHIGTRTEAKPFRSRGHLDGTTTVEVWRDWTYTWDPCHLPAGHESMHDWPMKATYTERTTP